RRRNRPGTVERVGRHRGSVARECVPGGGIGSRVMDSGRRYSSASQMKKKLSHYDKSGRARMVDVSAKAATKRTATAEAFVKIRPAVLKKLPKNPKGDPLEVARFAGIAAAKKTSDLIPMCHPLMLSHVDVQASIEKQGVRI